MYSMQGDTILDPFLGTGTTILAAIASNRNSIGYEIDPMFLEIITDHIESTSINYYNSVIQNRIDQHVNFINERNTNIKNTDLKYYNDKLKLPVMTSQETEIKLRFIKRVIKTQKNLIQTEYRDFKPKL